MKTNHSFQYLWHMTRKMIYVSICGVFLLPAVQRAFASSVITYFDGECDDYETENEDNTWPAECGTGAYCDPSNWDLTSWAEAGWYCPSDFMGSRSEAHADLEISPMGITANAQSEDLWEGFYVGTSYTGVHCDDDDGSTDVVYNGADLCPVFFDEDDFGAGSGDAGSLKVQDN